MATKSQNCYNILETEINKSTKLTSASTSTTISLDYYNTFEKTTTSIIIIIITTKCAFTISSENRKKYSFLSVHYSHMV